MKKKEITRDERKANCSKGCKPFLYYLLPSRQRLLPNHSVSQGHCVTERLLVLSYWCTGHLTGYYFMDMVEVYFNLNNELFNLRQYPPPCCKSIIKVAIRYKAFKIITIF